MVVKFRQQEKKQSDEKETQQAAAAANDSFSLFFRCVFERLAFEDNVCQLWGLFILSHISI